MTEKDAVFIEDETLDHEGIEIDEQDTPENANDGVDTGGGNTDDNGTEEGQDGSQDDTSEAPAGIEVKFRGERKVLSPDDAVKYAQMGLVHEDMGETLDSLQYLAASAGAGSVKEFVAAMRQQQEEAARQMFTEHYPDNPQMVERMMAGERALQKQRRDDMVATEQAASDAVEQQGEQERIAMLADQVEQLQEVFPEIKTFDDIPQAVKDMAFKEDMSFLTAMLIHERNQNQAKSAAADKAEKNKQAATGSKSTPPDAPKKSTAAGQGFLAGMGLV